MKKFKKILSVMILTTVFILLGVAAQSGCKNKTGSTAGSNTTAQAKEIYYCPMHPDYTSDKPGTCPECGMTLVKKEKPVTDANGAVSANIEQTMCPVLTDNKIDKNIYVEYKGKKVYFCCTDCKAAFEKDPEKYITMLPQFK